MDNKFSDNNFMDMAIDEAEKNLAEGFEAGGPFGAIIVKDGEVIAAAHNTVIESKDPTAHAEINAIRKACRELDVHDLNGTQLYTNCMPCPMCLGAIVWANIKEVYYVNTSEDVAEIGFRDNAIYEYIISLTKHEKTSGSVGNLINLHKMENSRAKHAVDEFKNFIENIY